MSANDAKFIDRGRGVTIHPPDRAPVHVSDSNPPAPEEENDRANLD